MIVAGLGKPLIRERIDVERYLVWGYPAIAFAVGSFFLYVGLSFDAIGGPLGVAGVAFFLVGVAFITIMFLGLPRRGGIYEHGLLLSVSRWHVIMKRGQRIVWARDIEMVWPVMDVRPIENRRYFVGYEVVFSGGRGRVECGDESEDHRERAEFNAAMRTMLGPRWDAVSRPTVQLGDEEVESIRITVSGPQRNWDSKISVGLAIALGGLIVGQFTVSLQNEGVGAPWMGILEASFIAMAIGGLCLMAVGWWSSAPRKRAIALYWQIRDYERETGTRILPDFPVHPDFSRLAPALDAGQAELQRLVREIGKERRGIGLLAITIMSPLLGLAIMWTLDLPFWTIAVPVVFMFASFLFMMRMTGAAAEAGQRIEAIIQEEWKTGRAILPPGARIPRRYLRFVTPPLLTDSQLKRMRLVQRIGRRRLVIIPIVGILVALSVLPLHLRGWPAIVIVGGSIGLGMFFFIWAEGHESFLRRLREYERVSGRTVLPPDLRLHKT